MLSDGGLDQIAQRRLPHRVVELTRDERPRGNLERHGDVVDRDRQAVQWQVPDLGREIGQKQVQHRADAGRRRPEQDDGAQHRTGRTCVHRCGR